MAKEIIQPGDPAPDFALPDQDGTSVRLRDLRGRAVVLFFYPKDDSPGCTAEACAFRDAYEAFAEAGAEVVGVSADPADSHRRFAERNRLPFRLLTDADGAVRAAYGVPTTFGLIPGRVTFVIDREGVVRHAFNSQFRARRHVEEALGVIRGLA